MNKKIYKVYYNPDFTQGGKLSDEGYIFINSNWVSDLWVEDWVLDNIGRRIVFLETGVPILNWIIEEVDFIEVNESSVLARLYRSIL